MVAKTAGFCFGVRRAVQRVEDTIEQEPDANVYTLGPIIHNKQVINELEKKGVRVIEKLLEAPSRGKVIIRSHGVPHQIYKDAEENDIDLIDATCPFVEKIHKRVKENSEHGAKIIIIGDKEHPEVIGIKGWADNALVISNEEDALKVETDGKYCVVAQTTLQKEKWEKICEILKKRLTNVEFFNTICIATDERQNEAKEIAQKADIMIVIGDPDSSNSRKLFEICKEYCENSYFVETANDLKPEWFQIKNKEYRIQNTEYSIQRQRESCQNRAVQGVSERGNGAYIQYVSTEASEATQQCDDYHNFPVVGITAGASTPARIIEEVISKMSEVEEKTTTTEEMSFAELFEGSIKRIFPGETIKGKVIRATQKDVFVDLGYKADGVIPLDEFSDNPEDKPDQLYKAGDEIEAFVVSINDGDGNVLLSRKRLGYVKGWETIMSAFESGEFLKAIVTDTVNSGVLAMILGTKVFIPASLLSDRRIEDLNEFLKKAIMVKIIDVNEQKKRAVASHKAFLIKEKEIAKKDAWDNIKVGEVVKGTVKRLADFGAFVDIGGVDGLVHISELSWGRIKHPSEVVKEGQVIEVKILELNKENEKISLGYRITMDNPWDAISAKYQVGKVVSGKVVNMMPFGAFVELEPGVTALVHISQISDKRINKPQEALQMGQEVTAKITEIDEEKKKMSLSIKELMEPEQKAEADSEETPAEHTEEMKLTLGELVKAETTAVVEKDKNTALKEVKKEVKAIVKTEKKEEKEE